MKDALFSFIALFTIFSVIPAFGQLAESPWPMYQQNAQHTGQSPYNGPDYPKLLWKFAGTYEQMTSDPAIGYDSTISFGTEDNCLYSFYSNGIEKWHFQAEDEIENRPVIDTNEVIYFNSKDGYLYALNSNGSEKWKFDTGMEPKVSPTIGEDGTVYSLICKVNEADSSEYYYLAAFNFVGTEKWLFKTGNVSLSVPPVIGTDGVIYFHLFNYDKENDESSYFFVAINPDGSEKWRFQAEKGFYCSPLIAEDGTIYVVTNDKILRAINPEGNERWNHTFENYSHLLKISEDGSIITRTKETITTFDTKGTVKYEFTLPFNPDSLAVGSDGTIYFCDEKSRNTYLYANQLDGTIKWELDFGNQYIRNYVEVNILFNPDGTIYTFFDSKVFAVNPDGTIKWEYDVVHLYTLTYGVDGFLYLRCDTDFFVLTPYGTVKWNLKIGTGDFNGSPVLGKDGTIYLVSMDHHLYAVNPDGSKKWLFDAGERIYSTPAIDADGVIYFPSHDSNLYAINPDGTEKWKYDIDDKIKNFPVIGNDGTIYLIVSSRLYAFNPDGSLKWRDDNLFLNSSFAIGLDGTIYGGTSFSKSLLAINSSGNKIWEYKVEDRITEPPTICPNNTILVVADTGSYTDKKLYNINPDGTLNWSRVLQNCNYSSPAVDYDGNIYIYTNFKHYTFLINENYIYSLNSDGSERWQYYFGDLHLYAPPTIGKDGTIYITPERELHAINPDGTLKWKKDLESRESSPVVISNDGVLYITGDNELCAFGSGLAPSPTPSGSPTPTQTPRTDYKSPEVTIISPNNGEVVTGVVTIKVEAEDESGIATVRIRIGDDTWFTCIESGEYWTYDLDTSVYPENTIVFVKARAEDNSAWKNAGYSETIYVTVKNELSIEFNLHIDGKTNFSSGDMLKLLLDIKVIANTPPVDVYFIMVNPFNQYFSYPDWEWGINPMITNEAYPDDIEVKDVELLRVKLPENFPPVNYPGNYIFAIAAFMHDTTTIESNIGNVSIVYY